LGDRKVIGWKVSSSLTAEETAIAAYKKAKRNRPIPQPLIFHSDRGVQYACNQFTELIAKNSLITQSMSRNGNCWDNAVAESFFKTIKHEWVNRCVYKNHHAVELSIFDSSKAITTPTEGTPHFKT
jgi:putative transposase